MDYERFKDVLSNAGFNYGDNAATNAFTGFELGLKQNLTALDADDLIEEVERRGYEVDAESSLDQFSTREIRAYLDIEDDSDVDWNSLYNQMHCGNVDGAINELKYIIQQKTGRILV